MTSIAISLPTPKQIAEDPERVALDGLDHAIELTLRSLVAVHPGLGQPADRPYWLGDPSTTEIAAARIIVVTAEMTKHICRYLTALDAERDPESVDPIEEDLPF